MLKKVGLVLAVAAILVGGSSVLVQHSKQGNTASYTPPGGDAPVAAYTPPGGDVSVKTV